jgi:hypothetical protein
MTSLLLKIVCGQSSSRLARLPGLSFQRRPLQLDSRSRSDCVTVGMILTPIFFVPAGIVLKVLGTGRWSGLVFAMAAYAFALVPATAMGALVLMDSVTPRLGRPAGVALATRLHRLDVSALLAAGSAGVAVGALLR